MYTINSFRNKNNPITCNIKFYKNNYSPKLKKKKPKTKTKPKTECGGTWLAQAIEYVTHDPGVMSSGPTVCTELTLKNKTKKKPE